MSAADDAQALIARLGTQSVQLSLDGQRLLVRAPKGVLTEALQSEIAQSRADLINLLMEASGDKNCEPDLALRHEPFALTDIQKAYYLGRSKRFELGGVGIYGYMEIDCGTIDLDRLMDALHRTIERHDMLRCIILPDGQQQVLASVPRYIPLVEDLRAVGAEARDGKLAQIRAEMSHQVYSGHEWPFFELRMSRLADDHVRLHFGIDVLHIDMASTGMVLAEWVENYKHPNLVLPEIPVTYRDYCMALRAQEDSEAYQRSLQYWRRRIPVLSPAPVLPLRKPLTALDRPVFARYEHKLNTAEWSRLKANAADVGVTPSLVLMAVYARVLGAWSEGSRFTINVTIADRQPVHPRMRDVAGNFTSMLLVEVDDRDAPDFASYARRLDKQLLQDLEHRRASGVPVLREIAEYRGQPLAALFPVVFTASLGTDGYNALTGLGEMTHKVTMTPQVLIDEQVLEADGVVTVSWDVIDELFEPGVTREMFAAHTRLLRSLLERQAWNAALPSLLSSEQQARRAELNATECPEPTQILHRLFEANVDQRPEHLALITSRTTLSYAELDAVAEQLAVRLNDQGVGPNSIVAIMMDRGWEQVAAVIAIHKAGGAYLPIDAELPLRRRQQLLDDAKCRIVVTQAWLAEKLELSPDTSLLCVDGTRDLRGYSRRPPRQGPHDLAYVIYTSGSTGAPKGVMIQQRSVVNRMTDVVQRFGFDANDRAFAISSLSHDLSVFDIFGLLAVAGGTLVLPDAELIRDPAHWLELMLQHRVSVWNSVPAFMQMLVDHVALGRVKSPEELGALRSVILSGDFIPVPLPDRIRSRFPRASVISAGGPTESTVWDVCYPIGTIDPNWRSIPYGKPMRGARYHILRDDLRDCPDGVAGEMFLEGLGLSLGYLNDEPRTHERFVSHPETGARLYRSGDRGRFHADGNIEILGRSDGQVKVLGNRIELGEVEQVLQGHPEIERAFACLSDVGETPQLIAYVVPKSARARGESADHGSVVDAAGRMAQKLEAPWSWAPGPNGHDVGFEPMLEPDSERRWLMRRSARRFESRSVMRAELGKLLSLLRPLDLPGRPARKYRYPSAGSLYPVLTFVLVAPDRVEGLPAGLYYHQPADHRLICIEPDLVLDATFHVSVNRSIANDAAFGVFFVADVSRVEPLYGTRARDFCLLEAGYMAQLLMTEAPDLNLGLCPIGGVDDERARTLFGAGGRELVHALLGGAIDSADESYALSTPRQTQHELATELSAELRGHVRAHLPSAMVPAHVMVLDALPLSRNGKVDRSKLPSVDRTDVTALHVAPRNELESRLASEWCHILKREAVDIHTGFFDLGGSSVQLVQLHARLSAALDASFSVRDLLEFPTIAELAGHLNGGATPAVTATAQAESRAKARRDAGQRNKRGQRESGSAQ